MTVTATGHGGRWSIPSVPSVSSQKHTGSPGVRRSIRKKI